MQLNYTDMAQYLYRGQLRKELYQNVAVGLCTSRFIRDAHAGRIVTIELGETVLRVYNERVNTLINQVPRTSINPLALFKTVGALRRLS